LVPAGIVALLVAVLVRVNANAPLVIKELPSITVNVADVVGAVIVSLLILVAVATPNMGVTNVGVLANTNAPVPVSSVIAEIRFALDGVANQVATPVPSPVIDPTAGVMVTLLAAVISPFPFTVNVPVWVALPKLPTFEFTVANVPAAVTFAEPLKEGEVYAKSPVIAIVLPVVNVAAEPVVL
jgi:hypothetical protein